MSKSISVVDNYDDSKLTEELRSLAEAELRETKETRDYAITAIREMIQQNPRIEKARMGT